MIRLLKFSEFLYYFHLTGRFNTMMITIQADGHGDYPGIGAALEAIAQKRSKDPQTMEKNCDSTGLQPYDVIFLKNGIYHERVAIDLPFITLVGESEGGVVITGGLYAKMPSDDIGKLGTFRTYSFFVDSHDFTARNITFENAAGPGPEVGQALAVYADGDRLTFENCRFLAGQDTLFTAPLPPKEIEPNGFVGPGQSRPRTPGRHYYKNCYFEGDVDFIFGGATAYFEACEFFSKDIGQPINGYVTAASTPEGQEYGYVMDHCRFTGSCPRHTVYLGRPWREYAKVVLLNCEIGEHICEEGWHDWNKPQAHTTTYFAEYQNYGPSSDPANRPAWVHQLTKEQATRYQRHLVLRGNDNWNP
jgi:pectinesterase